LAEALYHADHQVKGLPDHPHATTRRGSKMRP
jgi:hypothetical protein